MTAPLGKCPMCGTTEPSPCCVGEFLVLSVPWRVIRGIKVYRVPGRISIARLKALGADKPVRGLIVPPDDLA